MRTGNGGAEGDDGMGMGMGLAGPVSVSVSCACVTDCVTTRGPPPKGVGLAWTGLPIRDVMAGVLSDRQPSD